MNLSVFFLGTFSLRDKEKVPGAIPLHQTTKHIVIIEV